MRDERDDRIERLELENASLRSLLSAADWIAFVVVAAGSLALLSLATIAPTFAEMYREFGSPLPLVTRLAVHSATGPVLSVVPLVLLGLAARRSLAVVKRRSYLAFAFAFILLSGFAYWRALYAPIFDLAGKVQ